MSLEKTALLERKNIAIELLVPSEINPNEMSDAEFNLLCDNIQRVGFTDPILVRPMEGGEYRIVGGHHRVDGGKLLGYTEVPCTVILDPEFDDDEAKFQSVRHNIIHGKMSPKKFVALYESLSKKYEDEIAAELFGFADEELFKAMIDQTKKALPKDLQDDFEEAAKDVKTVEELATVLNHLLSTYGDTLEYNYMVVDFGGKDSIWLRMHKQDRVNFDKIASTCKEKKVTVDQVFRNLMLLALEPSEEGVFSGEEVVISDMVLTPTEEELAKEL